MYEFWYDYIKPKMGKKQIYFLIPSSIENNIIYLFITPSQTGLNKKHNF